MAITKKTARQYPLNARVDFTYADLGTAITTSTILAAIDLPSGATVTSGWLGVTTAWVGPTAATVDIGDDVDPNRYTSSPLSLKTVGKTALTFAGVTHPYKYPAGNAIDLDLVQSVAVSTQGVGYLEVEYVIDGRENEHQG